MKSYKFLSVAMLAVLTACAASDDSAPEQSQQEPSVTEQVESEPVESEAVEVADKLDRRIPQVARAEVMSLQKDALALPMPTLQAAKGHATRYDSITGSHLSARSVDLCELAYLFDGGAGRYRVIDIVSVSEKIEIDGRMQPAAFTYIQLELLKDWSGFAPSRPVLRIRGGALDAELTQTWDIGVQRGEELGLFLSSPLKGLNKGYYRTNALGVFRKQADGGYSNGQLFHDDATSLDELGRISSELYQSLPQVIHRPPWRRLEIPRDRCAHDVQPDAHQHDIDLDALRAKQGLPEEVELEQTPTN